MAYISTLDCRRAVTSRRVRHLGAPLSRIHRDRLPLIPSRNPPPAVACHLFHVLLFAIQAFMLRLGACRRDQEYDCINSLAIKRHEVRTLSPHPLPPSL